MHQGAEQQMPSFNLPSKTFCKVVNVLLRVEPETDEVYAQITLLSELDLSALFFLSYRSGSCLFLSFFLIPALFSFHSLV
ncbi:hypothetical protein QN277_012348 [Acacia crassicarpa]|uniref:Uncharacterized protein n=1 Tax=Acacia crassicarpa TaxID=499986 RepID=A0AAE1N063_9FABA|nr:hypothetical protein QN277_012348 [Acacia crassicarpa]